jgi:mannose-6-phosphate isomerase-like protein (cupin superfamily)
MSQKHRAVDRAQAPHYVWGSVCDGWRLLQGDDLSVIEERVPAQAGERWHHHALARQFFYIVSGRGTLEFQNGTIELQAGQGIEVAPGVVHRFANASDADVTFLVISAPSTADDRIEHGAA